MQDLSRGHDEEGYYCVGRMVEGIMQVNRNCSCSRTADTCVDRSNCSTVLVATKRTAGTGLLGRRASYCFTARAEAMLAARRKWPKGGT